MNKTTFDPNLPGVANGNYFGFPYNRKEAKIVLLPIPWDVTTSYGHGTSDGPQAILNASLQLDFYDPFIKKAWETRIATLDHRPFESSHFDLEIPGRLVDRDHDQPPF